MVKNKCSIYSFLRLMILTCCLLVAFTSHAQYQLRVRYADKDSLFNPQVLKLQTNFVSKIACLTYVAKIPAQLNLLGFISASVDSMEFDSSFATIVLFHGKQQHWIDLRPDSIDKRAVDESGFLSKTYINQPINIANVKTMQQRILNFYEKNGYPFASVYLDSIVLKDDGIKALIKVNKGPLYHIDSIHIYGKAKISNDLIQRYLGIMNGSIYDIEKLQQISRLLLQLPYLQEIQPSNLTMLGTGSILNLYLDPKRSSQADFLIGFAPSSAETNKLLVTGNADLNLKNSLGNGETILLNWQQLQQSSPRLDLGYQQPYIFKSPFGIDFSFDMFKKDSTYLQLSTQIGVQYLLSANQSGKIFLQDQSTILLSAGADTAAVIATKTLPPAIDADAVSVGIDYTLNNTNYRFNPKSGNELDILASVGIKNIKKNSTILAITDTTFNYASLYDSLKLRSYQFKLVLSAAHYFPTGQQSTFKTAVNIGIFSSQSIFENDLFQIGGYKLLRGFDEQSIYATEYGVATLEFHYLIGLNSYLFPFLDLGWAKEDYQYVNTQVNFIGTGLGLEFETKIGLLNISYAIGDRSDMPFNLSEASKIHFGYINYF